MLFDFDGKKPVVGEGCFIAETASVVGEVIMGKDCSVWHGAAVRADFDYIRIGDNTNIQDNATIHNDFNRPVIIGNNVTIAHNAIVHSCTVEDGSMIGMGAVVLDHVVVGEGSLIGAGAVVTKNLRIPPHSLVMGIPARIIRRLSDEEVESIRHNADLYYDRKNIYLKGKGE